MPAFGKTSSTRLNGCHGDLQAIFREVVIDFDCTIICGPRGKLEQEAACEAGNSKCHWPHSKHNSTPSMAVDAGPWPLDWDDHIAMGLLAGWVACTAGRLYREGKISHKIRWGGDWDGDNANRDNKFNDLVHFELVAPA